MTIDPKTSKIYGKFDIVGRDAPEYLVAFLREHTSSGINKYRRMRRGSPEQFTENETIALAITFGRDRVEFESHFDHEKGEIVIRTEKPVRVTVEDKKLNIEVDQREIVLPDM